MSETTTKRSPYKVTDKVPVPPPPVRHKYPFLKVGESFFVPNKRHNEMSGVLAHRKPEVHVIRTVTEDGVKGVRIWRTE